VTGPEEPEVTTSGPDRMAAFSDGVFAIAITLLVLPLTEADVRSGHVVEDLSTLGPRFFTFALSFLVIGLYWISHHEDVRLVVRVDRRLLALNLLFLFFMVFLPLPTSVLGQTSDAASVILYAATIMGASLSSLAIWVRAARHDQLLAGAPSTYLRSKVAGTVSTVAAFAVSTPIALVSTRWGQLAWLLAIPFGYLGDRIAGLRVRRR